MKHGESDHSRDAGFELLLAGLQALPDIEAKISRSFARLDVWDATVQPFQRTSSSCEGFDEAAAALRPHSVDQQAARSDRRGLTLSQ